jgi:glutamine synthetase
MFDKYRIFNEREVRARYEIAVEQYNKTVNVEAQTMVLMASRYILPAGLAFQKSVADTVNATKAAGVECAEGRKLLEHVCAMVCELKRATDRLQHELEHSASSAEEHAKHFRDRVIPAMDALREAGDRVELVVPSDAWPLPTYREMLFIK